MSTLQNTIDICSGQLRGIIENDYLLINWSILSPYSFICSQKECNTANHTFYLFPANIRFHNDNIVMAFYSARPNGRRLLSIF